MTLEESRQLLFIDKHNLDEELIQQPQRFSDVCDALALETSRRDEASDAVKEIEAKLAGTCRTALENEDKKVTEAMVKSAINSHPEYLAAKVTLREAADRATHWSNRKEAFMQRGFMLRSLCDLFGANYYERASTSNREAEDRTYEANRKAYKEGKHAKPRKVVTSDD